MNNKKIIDIDPNDIVIIPPISKLGKDDIINKDTPIKVSLKKDDIIKEEILENEIMVIHSEFNPETNSIIKEETHTNEEYFIEKTTEIPNNFSDTSFNAYKKRKKAKFNFSTKKPDFKFNFEKPIRTTKSENTDFTQDIPKKYKIKFKNPNFKFNFKKSTKTTQTQDAYFTEDNINEPQTKKRRNYKTDNSFEDYKNEQVQNFKSMLNNMSQFAKNIIFIPLKFCWNIGKFCLYVATKSIGYIFTLTGIFIAGAGAFMSAIHSSIAIPMFWTSLLFISSGQVYNCILDLAFKKFTSLEE